MDKNPKTYKNSDVEGIISLADEIQKRIVRSSFHITLIRFVQLTLLLISIGSIMLLNLNLLPQMYALCFAIFYVVLMDLLILRKIFKQRQRDRQDLKELVQILAESGERLISEAKWSELDKAHFRMRLSRFNIG